MFDDDDDAEVERCWSPEVERCWSRGDALHDYGRCRHDLGHDYEHEDEEGHSWM